MKLQNWLRNRLRSLRYYRCWKCGYEVLKSAALLSGGPGFEYGWHVHCPNCGSIIACDLYFWTDSPLSEKKTKPNRSSK